MRHRANRKFWEFYRRLPDDVRQLADDNYAVLKYNSKHPSLRLKKVGRFWSARVGVHYRAIAIEEGADLVWLWIGHHSEYDRLLARKR
jgi:hypothetical protein